MGDITFGPPPRHLRIDLPKAKKFDEGKTRYDLLPADALDKIATVFTFGSVKYGDRNWENGMSWGRLFGALMRHSWAWFRGEDHDPESGESHLAHAGCCVMMLLAYSMRKDKNDDRVTLGPRQAIDSSYCNPEVLPQ